MPLLISVVGFCVILLVCYYLYSYFTAEAMTPAERLEKFLLHSQGQDSEKDINARLVAPPNEVNDWRKRIQSLGSVFDTTSWAKRAENKLVQAGLNLRASEFAVITIGSMLLLMLFLFLVSGGSLLMAFIGLVLGYILPILIVKRKISVRRKKFNSQIADALVLISSSLRSGYSFMQAIEMVSREMHPPISEEFYRVLREINLGVTTDEAMNHMAERINSVDLDLVVTAVLIQRQIGGNLTEILDNIANTIRERVKIAGHIRTLTAQGRLSGAIISLLPIVMAFVIYIINPNYIMPLFTQTAGYWMLIMAAVSEIFGILVIKKIVDIKI
ncbi:MAG: type II secretion system F family protein [Negativicutes bacterium]|nr:type II secretion system F family protein [Negativicutes bacterium]